MTRERSKSPFPAAFRVICDIENEQMKTVIKEPDEELLDACSHRGKRCRNCRTWDELAIGWVRLVSICDEDGYQKEEWVCKLCMSERESLRYTYSASDLRDSGAQTVETPFGNKKKRRRP